MGEEWVMAMAFRFIKEALPVVIPPVWKVVRSAVGRALPDNGTAARLETIVGSHTERLAQLQTELEGQRIVQLQLHERIRILSWLAVLSTVLSLLAILAVIIVGVVK